MTQVKKTHTIPPNSAKMLCRQNTPGIPCVTPCAQKLMPSITPCQNGDFTIVMSCSSTPTVEQRKCFPKLVPNSYFG